MTETERRFRVVSSGYLEHVSEVIQIRQGYLGKAGEAEVRVRFSENSFGMKACVLTIKGPKKEGSGLEVEKEITPQEFLALMQMCDDRVILKTRHIVKFAGHTFEVDEFRDRHEGLVLAEVELDDVAEQLDLPDWIGDEVTGELGLSNYELAHAKGGRDEGQGR